MIQERKEGKLVVREDILKEVGFGLLLGEWVRFTQQSGMTGGSF